MTAPILFFSLSGFAMIYLVVHKRIEMAFGRGLIFKNILHKGDGLVHRRMVELKHILAFVNKRNIVLTLNYIVVLFIKAAIFISSAIKKEMSSALDKLTRKQETLTKKGAASAYLKQISESKHNGNGKDDGHLTE